MTFPTRPALTTVLTLGLVLPVLTAGCEGILAQGGGPTGPVLRVAPDAVAPSNQSTTDVRTADLDLDGDLDLVWTGQAGDPERWPDGSVVLSINDGTGWFEPSDTGIADLGPWTFVSIADVDGDGSPDLVLTKPARTTTEIAVLLNDGAAHFRRATVPDLTGEADGIVFGQAAPVDVDGDGDVDLVVPMFADVAYTTARPNVLLMNDGSGTYTRDTEGRIPELTPDTDWTLSIGAGDVDGDGAPDLFLGEADRAPRLLVNDGAGHFVDRTDDDGSGTGTPSLPPDVMRAYRTELADLDLDGDLDVTVINDASAAADTTLLGNFFFHNDGAGHFDLWEMPLPGGRRDTRGLTLADMDGDGRPDIVVGNGNEIVPHEGDAVSVLLARGDEYVSDVSVPTFDFGVFGVAAGDFDGDGRCDLALAVALPGGSGELSNVVLHAVR